MSAVSVDSAGKLCILDTEADGAGEVGESGEECSRIVFCEPLADARKVCAAAVISEGASKAKLRPSPWPSVETRRPCSDESASFLRHPIYRPARRSSPLLHPREQFRLLILELFGS